MMAWSPRAGRLFGVREHLIGHAVRRDDPRLMRDAEFLENLHCVLQGGPVTAGPHHHADLDRGHALLLKNEF
jgi:hypothetical protein